LTGKGGRKAQAEKAFIGRDVRRLKETRTQNSKGGYPFRIEAINFERDVHQRANKTGEEGEKAREKGSLKKKRKE